MKTNIVRTIYLVRHGKPDFPEGIRRCIGRTDLPLSEEGRRQAYDLKEYFSQHAVGQIFTSTLGRCVETAEILSGGRIPVQAEPGLQELDMGEWENVPLRKLHKELESEPERGEGRKAGLDRFGRAVEEIVRKTTGDVAVVAHAGVNCCYLSDILGTPLETSRALPQPYGGLSRIVIMDGGTLRVEELGVMPKQVPDGEKCEAIWNHYHTPGQVREHCRAVCGQALSIGRQLEQAGCELNLELIRSAALLHDVARTKPDHAREGATVLVREGYPAVAEIIGKHHDLVSDDRSPGEAEVVYLADKYIKGRYQVTLEERFADSRKRCVQSKDSEEALAVHERRYREAKKIERKIFDYIEKGNP